MYAIGLCLFFTILATGVYFIADGSRRWLSLPFFCVAALVILFSLWRLIFPKPILTADDVGIYDTRQMKTPIPWADILAFRHVPRYERVTRREISFSPFDGWRPIHLWVVPQEPTIVNRLQALSPHPVHSDFPQAQFILIDFAGLDISSNRLVDLIRNFAPTAKELYS